MKLYVTPQPDCILGLHSSPGFCPMPNATAESFIKSEERLILISRNLIWLVFCHFPIRISLSDQVYYDAHQGHLFRLPPLFVTSGRLPARWNLFVQPTSPLSCFLLITNSIHISPFASPIGRALTSPRWMVVRHLQQLNHGLFLVQYRANGR